MRRRTNFGLPERLSSTKMGSCASSSNFDEAPPLIILAFLGVVFIYFAVVVFGTQGFFADEFRYFSLSKLSVQQLLSQERILSIRQPFVPLVLKALSPFGLEFGNDAGLWAFRFLVWSLGLAGAFFLGKELADGNSKLGWLFVLVLGTSYVWVFYSAKVLTDALVVTEALWLFFFVQKTINAKREGGFAVWEAWFAAGFMVLAVGLLTKPTFLAFVPLSAVFVLAPRQVSLFAVGAGYAFLAGQASISLVLSGADRYFLPFLVFLFLGLVVYAWFLDARLAVLSAVLLCLSGIHAFAVFAPVDLPKFGEMQVLSRLNGTVAANLEDYARFYCPSCRVVSWKSDGIGGVDWVALQRKDECCKSAVDVAVGELAGDARFDLFLNVSGLTVFRRYTAVSYKRG